MKSKAVAYILLILMGVTGAQWFYLGRFGRGLLYLFTGGFFGLGLLVDFFTLDEAVDDYNWFHHRAHWARAWY